MADTNTNLCKICCKEIPVSAMKCTHCSSYQNWRRHVSIGQNSLALLVALVALIGPAISTIWGVYEDFSAKNSKRLEVALVEMSDIHVGVLISNRSDGTVVVNRFSCALWLPFNNDFYYDGNNQEGNIRWPTKNETIGVTWVTYVTDHPIILAKEQQSYTVFFQRHMTPIRNRPAIDDGDEAISLCSISAVNDKNNLEVDAIFLTPSDLLMFDALKVVKEADYSDIQEDERQSLIIAIEQKRKPQ